MDDMTAIFQRLWCLGCAVDPLKDISAMRRVRRVMLNGNWVDLSAPAAPATRELLHPVPTPCSEPQGAALKATDRIRH